MLQGLIGRTHEIFAIEGPLEACPVWLLHGPKGIWKKELSPGAKESHLFIDSLLVDSEIPNALEIVTSFFA